MDALIGWTGFVGESLLRQRTFDRLYRSTNITDIQAEGFETVICAGAPAQKWIADREPGADRANIERLASALANVNATRFILISTVDVFSNCSGATENSIPDEGGLSPYGRNRLWLERFVANRFEKHLIVRLTGLVGPGLRKNAIFDLHNGNNLRAVDARAVYQFYPMVNLLADIAVALRTGLSLVHLTAEPLSIGAIAEQGFGRTFSNEVPDLTPPRYDLRTQHGAIFGRVGDYTYDRRESLLAIRAYAQSEQKKKFAS